MSLQHAPLDRADFPSWTKPGHEPETPGEAGVLAGAALHAIDAILRSEAPWLGCWRMRLALHAAIADRPAFQRPETLKQARDALVLSDAGSDPGPDGRVVQAFRLLGTRSTWPDTDRLRSICALLGIGWHDGLDELETLFDAIDSSRRPAPMVAAALAANISARVPHSGRLAWWLADLALARRMRWEAGLPLLSTQLWRATEQSGAADRALAVEFTVLRNLTVASRLAWDTGRAISVRAESLLTIAPKLRSKQSPVVIASLLSDDAISATRPEGGASRWAWSRTIDRMLAFDAVAELTGRDSFRIVGL